jgi:hypothetical protein
MTDTDAELREDAGAKNERRWTSYPRNATAEACSGLREDAGARNSRRCLSSTSKEKSSSPDTTCEHIIVEDLIDITPDTSKYIYYCEKCYECFAQGRRREE